MRNQSFAGEVSLSSVYRWPTWTFQVSALMNCLAKALLGETTLDSLNLPRSSWPSSLAAPPTAGAAAGSSSISSPTCHRWVSCLENCTHICQRPWQSPPPLPLTERENRGLSAENAPKTDAYVTAVGHHEPVTFTTTATGWIGRMRKKEDAPVGKDNHSSSNYTKPYKPQNSLGHQRINRRLKADEMSLF